MRTTLVLVLVICATIVAGIGWTGTITAIAPSDKPNAALVTTFTSTGLTTCILDSDTQIAVLTDIGTRLFPLSVSDILDTTPLQGRTEPGYIGGFIIAAVLEEADGTLRCDTAQFAVDENVVGGSCWLDASGEIFVEGVHAVQSTDHRIAPSHFIGGTKADIPKFPNRLANCLSEGYFGDDGNYYFFSFTIGNAVTPFPVPVVATPELAAVDETGTTEVVPDATVADSTVVDTTPEDVTAVDEAGTTVVLPVANPTVPETASTADVSAPESTVSASVADSVGSTYEDDTPSPPSGSPSSSPYSNDEGDYKPNYYKQHIVVPMKARLNSDDCNYHGHHAPSLILYGSHKLRIRSIRPETLSLGRLYPRECYLVDANYDGREDLVCQYYGVPHKSYGKYDITGKTEHGLRVKAVVYPCNHRRHW